MGKWTWTFIAIRIGLEAIVFVNLGFAWLWGHRRSATEQR